MGSYAAPRGLRRRRGRVQAYWGALHVQSTGEPQVNARSKPGWGHLGYRSKVPLTTEADSFLQTLIWTAPVCPVHLTLPSVSVYTVWADGW